MDKSNYASACCMCLGENFVLASYSVDIVNSVIGNFGDDLHDGRLVVMKITAFTPDEGETYFAAVIQWFGQKGIGRNPN